LSTDPAILGDSLQQDILCYCQLRRHIFEQAELVEVTGHLQWHGISESEAHFVGSHTIKNLSLSC